MRLAVAALVLVALCAGCGGGGGGDVLSGSEYRARLAAIEGDSGRAHVKLEQGLRAGTPAALAASLRSFGREEDRAGDRIDELQPPSDAVAANDELATGLHDLAAAYDALAPKAERAETPAAAVVLLERDQALASAGQRIDHALAVLRKLGYEKGE